MTSGGQGLELLELHQAVLKTKFAEHPCHVRLDRFFAGEQALGDLPITAAARGPKFRLLRQNQEATAQRDRSWKWIPADFPIENVASPNAIKARSTGSVASVACL